MTLALDAVAVVQTAVLKVVREHVLAGAREVALDALEHALAHVAVAQHRAWLAVLAVAKIRVREVVLDKLLQNFNKNVLNERNYKDADSSEN